jgi:hypothetical protein
MPEILPFLLPVELISQLHTLFFQNPFLILLSNLHLRIRSDYPTMRIMIYSHKILHREGNNSLQELKEKYPVFQLIIFYLY